MERIRDNVNYNNYVMCPTCGEKINYHITDVKGVDPKYILCTSCGNIIKL